MKIERRKLTLNKNRKQVLTSLNYNFIKDSGFDPDGYVNILYRNDTVILVKEENVDKLINFQADMQKNMKPYVCPTCGEISITKKCRKCNIDYDQ